MSIQSQKDFLPSSSVLLDTSLLYERLSNTVNNIPEELSRREKEAYEIALNHRKQDLIAGIINNQFLFNIELQQFAENIFLEIMKANNLAFNPIILIDRSQYPNASSLGDGIFIVNIGLFAQLSFVDELAFVFAHELAHDQLAHFQEKVLRLNQVDRSLNRGKTRFELKNMWRKGQNQRANLFLQNLIYSLQKNSRSNELSADSLAVSYLQNTPYSKDVGPQALHKISNYDFYNIDSLFLEEHLTTEEFPFQMRWLEEEKRMFGGQTFNVGEKRDSSRWATDSLKSHPAMKERIEWFQLQTLDERPETNDTFLLSIHPFIETAVLEGAEGLLANNYLAHALITALHLLKEHPDNVYLKALIGRTLLACFEAIEEHDFSKCLPSKQHFKTDACNQVAQVLHRMKQEEILTLSYYYLKENLEKNPDASSLQEAFAEVERVFNLHND